MYVWGFYDVQLKQKDTVKEKAYSPNAHLFYQQMLP